MKCPKCKSVMADGECLPCQMVFITVEESDSEVVTVEDLRRALIREMATDVKLVGRVMDGTHQLAERIRARKKEPKAARRREKTVVWRGVYGS